MIFTGAVLWLKCVAFHIGLRSQHYVQPDCQLAHSLFRPPTLACWCTYLWQRGAIGVFWCLEIQPSELTILSSPPPAARPHHRDSHGCWRGIWMIHSRIPVLSFFNLCTCRAELLFKRTQRMICYWSIKTDRILDQPTANQQPIPIQGNEPSQLRKTEGCEALGGLRWECVVIGSLSNA